MADERIKGRISNAGPPRLVADDFKQHICKIRQRHPLTQNVQYEIHEQLIFFFPAGIIQDLFQNRLHV